MNVQVIADPAGRLIWASPSLPGARHDTGAAREHGILDALRDAAVQVIADNGYRGSGFRVPQRRRAADPGTGERRRLSAEPEGRQLRARPAARAGGTRECAAQGLADLPQDPLLSDARDRPRQGHPRAHPRWLTPSGKSSVAMAFLANIAFAAVSTPSTPCTRNEITSPRSR
jgi:hypothetical protein